MICDQGWLIYTKVMKNKAAKVEAVCGLGNVKKG